MSLLLRIRTIVSVTLALFLAQVSLPAQTKSPDSSVDDTRSQLTTLRDAFVKEAAESGIPCAIKSPIIVVQDVPSFGSYDPDTNTLTSPAWEQMSTDEQSIFYKSLQPDAKEADARAEFEVGVHHWVIVHELGHWWEACRRMVDHGDHYAFELEANKIAAAYWSEHDQTVIDHQKAVFETIVKKWPDPVPPGQTSSTYFNTKYEALGPTPAYIWFQAQMCLTAFGQRPVPRFSKALAQVRAS
jgi:hypothetical protein